MNHKISEFCDKIDSIKKMSDRLREMKYGPVKAEKIMIDNMIQTIQADCLLVANDKGEYVQKIIMVTILVLSMTACSSMKKNEEGKYEINPIGTIIRTIIGVPDQLQLGK